MTLADALAETLHATRAVAQSGGEIGWLESIVLGLVQGLTEFLPISSTGHLIVTNALFGQSDPAFEVAIQAGTITAILVLYWRDVWNSVRTLLRPDRDDKRINLLVLILVAALPASALGLTLEDPLTAMFHPLTVATGLVTGGGVFLWIERWLENRKRAGIATERQIPNMGVRDALVIGLCQIFALIPGTSRSGATIVGGLLTGLARPAAAEFSFLVGLPILYGASLLKLCTDFDRLTGPLLEVLLLASGVSFVTALVIVGPFVRFLQSHTFRPFAYYRIGFGIVVFALWGAGFLAV